MFCYLATAAGSLTTSGAKYRNMANGIPFGSVVKLVRSKTQMGELDDISNTAGMFVLSVPCIWRFAGWKRWLGGWSVEFEALLLFITTGRGRMKQTVFFPFRSKPSEIESTARSLGFTSLGTCSPLSSKMLLISFFFDAISNMFVMLVYSHIHKLKQPFGPV